MPLDGEVVSAGSAVNQTPITGESMPVEKKAGDKVFAGSINGEGALELRVTKPHTDTMLAFCRAFDLSINAFLRFGRI